MSSLKALRALAWTSVAAICLGLTACGGGDGNDSSSTNNSAAGASQCTASTCGDVLVALTDADGDFLSYSVDVVALTLKKANGTVVQALPNRARVDFAQLTDLTELLSAATIPNGTYVEGSIRLDFGTAEVTVEVNGLPKPATVVGEDGQPLGVVDLQIMLDNANHVVVAPGRPALLQLDFDLAATHTVDLSTTPVTATARPLIVATIEPVDEKAMRLRGPVVGVDTSAGTYTIDVRPFFHRTARFGRMKVHTTAQTQFEVDGAAYAGEAGLAALAQLGDGAATAAFGTLDTSARTFTAERVNAGTSVPGAGFDVLWGNVIARQGDTLTVRGGTLIRRSGSVTFIRDDMTVLVGSGTAVTREGQRDDALTDDAISVGQGINAFGLVNEDAGGHITLDATGGRVRMQITHLWGTVKSTVAGLLTVDLDAIDGRRVSSFDFSGTGASPATDADPAHYEIATGSLNLGSLEAEQPARVFGFVTPFGTAAPDFSARSVADLSTLRAVLGLGWGLQGTRAPFLSIDANGIVIDNTNADIGTRHFIAIGPRLLDITTLASSPTLSPAGSFGVYAIGQGRRVEVFASFEAFAARLGEKLGAGGKAVGMNALGLYDPSGNTLNAREIHVMLAGTD